MYVIDGGGYKNYLDKKMYNYFINKYWKSLEEHNLYYTLIISK